MPNPAQRTGSYVGLSQRIGRERHEISRGGQYTNVRAHQLLLSHIKDPLPFRDTNQASKEGTLSEPRWISVRLNCADELDKFSGVNIKHTSGPLPLYSNLRSRQELDAQGFGPGFTLLGSEVCIGRAGLLRARFQVGLGIKEGHEGNCRPYEHPDPRNSYILPLLHGRPTGLSLVVPSLSGGCF